MTCHAAVPAAVSVFISELKIAVWNKVDYSVEPEHAEQQYTGELNVKSSSEWVSTKNRNKPHNTSIKEPSENFAENKVSSCSHDYRKNDTQIELDSQVQGKRNKPLKSTQRGFQRRVNKIPHMKDTNKAVSEVDDFTNDTSIQKVIKPMKFSQICKLVEKQPNEIVLTLLNKIYGFNEILFSKNINRNMMAYVLIALGKACSSQMRSNVNHLISTVSSTKELFIMNLQNYLITFQKYPSEQSHLNSLVSLTEFLQLFQQSVPSNASDCILLILPLLRVTCQKSLVQAEELYSTVMEKLEEIESQNEFYMKKYTPAEIKQTSHKENLQLQNPPEDYRTIPVLPTAEDVCQAYVFLRPNVVCGQYQDSEHYLDVQYRLLREDYVRPLRDGISEYLRLKKSGKSLKNFKDVRIYHDVHIMKQDFVNGGLVHIADFNADKFKNVKWEFSKRFLTGSLLCLSSDDFKTMLFASVARRIPAELKKGLLLLRFEEVSDEVLNLNPLRSFDVIETDAYFEAYRYNLNALHELNAERLPMKQYIVNVQKTVNKPQYLRETTQYDMRPLLIPLESTYVKCTENLDGEVSTSYEFPPNISQKYKYVSVCNDTSWPTFTEMNLDDSQFTALKAAITKEFAIIQGPPGTGKTFIGLRIVQLLLHNISKWQSVATSPILIVCYTNHALDQFLEGLLLFTQRIVRVGGRGTNEAVSKFQLSNLKMLIQKKRVVPNYIFSSMKQKNYELRSLKTHIDSIRKSIEQSLTSVLGESTLRNYMPDKHFSSLTIVKHNLCVNDGYIIHDWLGIRRRVEDAKYNSSLLLSENNNTALMASKHKEVNQYVDVSGAEENLEEESEGEADVEYIEAQRDISTEEFADVSFDLPLNEIFEDIAEDGWKVQGGIKKRQKYIANCIKNSVAMTEVEAMEVNNVWQLNITHRWRLYKFWLQRYIEEEQKQNLSLQQQLRREYQELCEMRTEEDLYVLRNAQIVGMTTTGAAKYRSIVQRLNPKIIIVEEAAEILESHIVTSLAPGTEHVILIGDHQQLRPSPTVHLLAVQYDLNVSLFERMVKNGMDCFRLGIQHRMRPEIAALLVPHIYTSLQNHKSVAAYESVKGVSKNVFFVTHSYNELQECDSKSKVNQYEARFLIKFCNYLLLQEYDPSQITVLTTYSGQLFELKKLAAGKICQGVRFTVVDNYQGEENDIILLSFVRSNEEGHIGFLKIPNRVCVALSRAKKGLYCIGNFELLAEKSSLWKSIVKVLQQNQAIGPSLQLVCQNHPGVSNVVANDKDFDTVPEGGCIRNCEFRLSCGHVCSLMCHPYDRAHEAVRCLKPCQKTCDKGHPCKRKCFEKCGPCVKLVPKTIDSCGHIIQVQCYRKCETAICSKQCERFLPCGHQCTNKCSTDCLVSCFQKVKVKSFVCGHAVEVECFKSDSVTYLAESCKETCRAELICGHMCRGMCSSCHQGRLHLACNQKCKRILVCGHECKSPCSKSCPPCKQPCENRCAHSKCPKKCGEPCEKCTEPCTWSCMHNKCTRLCGELCDRNPCNEPCLELLPCKHPCIGLCGEPCPDKCRICNEEIVKEILFGSEDEEDARYICLEDCNHIFEVDGISHWMNINNQEKRVIQMKSCPKCKTVIRRNLRFGNIVKSCLADIEKVKKHTYGDKGKNMEKQHTLFLRTKHLGKQFELICKPLIKVLMSGKSRSIQEITTLENIINITLELIDSINIHSLRFKRVETDTSIRSSVDKLKSYLETTSEWLVKFIQDDYLTASEQQLQELTWEVHRLKLAHTFLKVVCERTEKVSNVHFENVIKCLITYSPFREADVKTFTSEFQSFVKLLNGAVINVSEMEKQSILKAMNLSKGHWYQCPNGHVYCITECGGAMQESHCNECGERIGGRNHSLLSDNRVATDMDGSRHSAWSAAMNMGDYNF